MLICILLMLCTVASHFWIAENQVSHFLQRDGILWGGGGPDQLKIPSAKICQNFHLGGEVCGPDQLKSQVPRSVQIFIFSGGGRRGLVVQTNIPEILEWGHSRNFEQNICQALEALVSQIVSHTLRVRRLINLRLHNYNGKQ